jgi:formate-nitrite transporter family protein
LPDVSTEHRIAMSESHSDPESEEAHSRAAPTGKVVYKAILQEGEDELKRPSSALFWSGLAAGLSMGFSLVAEGLLRHHLADTHYRPLIVKLGYSVGFLFVILGRQQLFTENTLTPILPLLQRKPGATVGNVLRLWSVVLAANLLGAVLFSLALVKTPSFDADVRATFVTIGDEAMRQNFGVTTLRAVFAGWLIALMVWLLPFAEAARVFVIVVVTWVVGVAEFPHIIAGSAETFAATWAGHRSWFQTLGGWVLPTLLGNVIGGVTLVTALNHAQVTAGGQGEDV